MTRGTRATTRPRAAVDFAPPPYARISWGDAERRPRRLPPRRRMRGHQDPVRRAPPQGLVVRDRRLHPERRRGRQPRARRGGILAEEGGGRPRSAPAGGQPPARRGARALGAGGPARRDEPGGRGAALPVGGRALSRVRVRRGGEIPSGPRPVPRAGVSRRDPRTQGLHADRAREPAPRRGRGGDLRVVRARAGRGVGPPRFPQDRRRGDRRAQVRRRDVPGRLVPRRRAAPPRAVLRQGSRLRVRRAALPRAPDALPRQRMELPRADRARRHVHGPRPGRAVRGRFRARGPTRAGRGRRGDHGRSGGQRRGPRTRAVRGVPRAHATGPGPCGRVPARDPVRDRPRRGGAKPTRREGPRARRLVPADRRSGERRGVRADRRLLAVHDRRPRGAATHRGAVGPGRRVGSARRPGAARRRAGRPRPRAFDRGPRPVPSAAPARAAVARRRAVGSRGNRAVRRDAPAGAGASTAAGRAPSAPRVRTLP